MERSFSEMSMPEKIGTVIGWIIAGVIVVTMFSRELTFAGIISWLVQGAGLYLFACIAIPVVIALLVALFIRALPVLMIACGFLGVWLVMSGVGAVFGVILLIIAGAIMWFITGLDSDF